MIRAVLPEDQTTKEALLMHCGQTACGCRMAGAFSVYGALPQAAQFWVSERAALSLQGDTLTVCGEILPEETDEFAAFVSFTGAKQLCMEESSGEKNRSGDTDSGKRCTLPPGWRLTQTERIYTKQVSGTAATLRIDPTANDGERMRNIYRILQSCAAQDFPVPDYAAFYADLALRQRRGAAFSVLQKNACGIVTAVTEQQAYIAAVAVCPATQRQGMGKEILRQIEETLPGRRLWVFCTPQKAGFYEKCGFSLAGNVHTCRLF